MKMIAFMQLGRKVDYHGIRVMLFEGERFIVADRNGKLFAYKRTPVLRPYDIDRGEWSLERSDPLPRFIGFAELEEVNWKESMVDFGDDPNFALT